MIIGILGYQGGGHLYGYALQRIGVDFKIIRTHDDFTDDLDCIILPGGESSVQMKYMQQYNLINHVKNFSKKIIGTCAGMILLSSYRSDLFNGLSMIDVELERNFYGAQIASGFYISDNNNEICFIRAPAISNLNLAKDIEVLDTFRERPILIRKNNIYCTSFHPEISRDSSFLTLKSIIN